MGKYQVAGPFSCDMRQAWGIAPAGAARSVTMALAYTKADAKRIARALERDDAMKSKLAAAEELAKAVDDFVCGREESRICESRMSAALHAYRTVQGL